jgi:response regulator RpfG family c-di-GMP phosphodiesterase
MKPTVLFVDDEPNILKAIRRLFRGESLTLHTVDSGQAALEIMDNVPAHVIVSDHRMPSMSGVDLLARVRERWPDVIRILVTGNSEMSIAVEAVNRGEIFRLLTKPWSDDEIRSTVKEALDLYLLKGEIKRLNQVTQEQNAELQELYQDLENKVAERTDELQRRIAELSLTHVNTIKALVCAIDAKHGYEGSHSERVGRYAGAIARRMGLEEARARRVYIAGLLHDVGILGIRENVLLKAGPLSEDEIVEMRKHPLLSVQILRAVPSLQDILPIIRNHHEWFNGDPVGYPDGLSGDSIDQGARILAVANVLDAMSSDRPHRPALSIEKVKAELRDGAGKQFDPEVIESALSLLSEHGERFLEQTSSDDFLQID